MEEAKNDKFNFIAPVLCVLGTLGLSAAAQLLFYDAGILVLLRNQILAALLSLTLVFVLRLSFLRGTLLYDNARHIGRFYLAFFLFLVGAVFFPLLPTGGWFYLAVFVTLCLFSNELCALISGTLLLTISFLLSGSTDLTVFFAYLLPGIVGILLFSTIGEDFQVFVPILVSVLMQLLTLSVSEVLMPNRLFTVTAFIFPLINAVVCVVVILIVLKLFSFTLIYKEQDRFMDILDPEFELLSMLRSTSKSDYDHAIYTAVLCSKMAVKLDLNEPLTKALGYYHRIGVLRGENNWENAEGVMREYGLPDNVIDHLAEYLDQNRFPKSKEATVLLFADTVISSISYLFSKDSDAQLNYDRLIGAIFDKKIESGIIDRSDISYGDINVMKKTLIEEKLFYDFLR